MSASPTANMAVREPISAPCTTIPRVGPQTTSLRTIEHDGGDGPGQPPPLLPGPPVEHQEPHDGHQAEDLLDPVRGLAEEHRERRGGADEQCSPGCNGPRRRRREPAQLALTVVAPRRRSPSPPWHNLHPAPAEPRCSAGWLLVA